MINAPTKTIETPISKHQVVMKAWITGADREYIDGSFLSGVDAKPQMRGKEMHMDIAKMDLEKLTNGAKHRAVEKFIVSVDGVTENVADLVFQMHEHDTDFILEQIDETGKKKE